MAERSCIGVLVLASASVASCVPGGVEVAPPEVEPGMATMVAVQRSTSDGSGAVRAEIHPLSETSFPLTHFRTETEVVTLFYEETAEALGRAPGSSILEAESADRLTPHAVRSFEERDADWVTLPASSVPDWARPFRLSLPCPADRRVEEHRFDQFWPGFVPVRPDERLPAITSLVALDETRALVATLLGVHFLLEWPRGGPVELIPVVSSTIGYQYSSIRHQDSLYLGGSGARIARASIAPLLEDPPRLVLEEELVLANRPPRIDHAVVSMSGGPGQESDLFLMTEDTEVFHLGPGGVSALGAMDARRPAFSPPNDRELRARQLAWVRPGEAVAVWFYDAGHASEPGPLLLSSSGQRTALSLPPTAAESLATETSVVFDPEHGLFVARSTFEDGGVRSELFRRETLEEPWTSFATLDLAVQNMVPMRSAVLATGGYFYFPQWKGAVARAHRGYHFSEEPEGERCVWLRTGGRHRLVARLGLDRIISTGTMAGSEPPIVFTYEL